MNPIYLDNAATTALDADVLEAMLPYLTSRYGNPSSLHAYGRETRIAIESARRQVAALLQVKPSEIVFTSGGTESNNTAILAAIRDNGCQHIISSAIEHHAVLHTVEYHAAGNGITRSWLPVSANGHISLADLEKQLAASGKKCLVSLMNANNETGNITDIEKVGRLCRDYGAFFHSDCVQTIGHYPINLQQAGVHFASASGHKFHGPKGTGILYASKEARLMPMILGGAHERGMRAGTENVAGIVGFAKALELAMSRYQADQEYIHGLKKYMICELQHQVPGIDFNGDISVDNSLYTVLNVSFPKTEQTEMLLLQLDAKGIAVSGGSACSGEAASHVIEALGTGKDRVAIRFSFCRHNHQEEIDFVIAALKETMQAASYA